jgi:2,5-diketo-D-gluconate reductase A
MATDVVTAAGRARVLADGSEIPLLGLGVWQVSNDRDCLDAVRWALELGYRHIDTAQAYGNERSVGQGLRESGVAPYEDRKALLDSCRQSGIALEAYSPLGTGRHLGSDTVARIARRHERTPAQVLLRWRIERGIPIIPKSTHRERIAENADVFDFALSAEDLAELDALDRTGGAARALERRWWRS